MPTISPSLPSPQAVIFDMDGVLIDVSSSYRAVIARTCEIYLTTVLNLRLPKKADLISAADISALKLVGGFNNDWDATAGLLTCLLASLVPVTRPLLPLAIPFDISISRLCQALQNYTAQFSPGNLADQPELRLGPLLEAAQGWAHQHKRGGFEALSQVLDAQSWAKVQVLLCNKGDLHHTNIVERIFQELYLGPRRFQASYNATPIFYREDGYIERETLIINPQTLARLQERGVKLGVATGRPGSEARYSLDFFQLNSYFQAVVTDDERSLAESSAGQKLGKPHPFVLLEAARQLDLDPGGPPIYYLGDVPDDVLAANRAKATMPAFRSVGLLSALPYDPVLRGPAAQTLRMAFERNAADYILEHPDQIAYSIWFT